MSVTNHALLYTPAVELLESESRELRALLTLLYLNFVSLLLAS